VLAQAGGCHRCAPAAGRCSPAPAKEWPSAEIVEDDAWRLEGFFRPSSRYPYGKSAIGSLSKESSSIHSPKGVRFSGCPVVHQRCDVPAFIRRTRDNDPNLARHGLSEPIPMVGTLYPSLSVRSNIAAIFAAKIRTMGTLHHPANLTQGHCREVRRARRWRWSSLSDVFVLLRHAGARAVL